MRKFSLLYVDDEESNLRIFKDTFRRKFNIFTATNAQKGIEILNNEKIDLVLSDQRMPEMTGVEFLKYSLEKYPEPNRILITGYSDFEAIEGAINEAHVFQYIQKPWSEDNLLRTIENALHIYNLEQENKRQKEELKIAKERAEESDRLKTEFINNMSHEIRTPLNGILGFSQVLNMPGITEDEMKSYTSMIVNCGEQLTFIIDDILEISALQTQKIEVSEKKINLNRFLVEQLTVFEDTAEQNKTPLTLHKALDDYHAEIYIDDDKLSKILLQLLRNAIKFTESGDIEFGYKAIDMDSDNPKIKLFVKDNGIGIAPENIEYIFKRFAQEEQNLTRSYGGLGLGLAIAKENATLIGGEITVESEKHAGATFFLTIPYKPVNKIKKQSSESSKTEQEKEKDKKPTILIAEDEEMNFFYLETLLTKILKTGAIIIHAENGLEAVDICKENQNIDLVLMDLKMPVKDGYEATAEIKEIRKDLPIIAQSAYTTYKDRERAKNAGCKDFIAKPIQATTVKHLLSKYLNKN